MEVLTQSLVRGDRSTNIIFWVGGDRSTNIIVKGGTEVLTEQVAYLHTCILAYLNTLLKQFAR